MDCASQKAARGPCDLFPSYFALGNVSVARDSGSWPSQSGLGLAGLGLSNLESREWFFFPEVTAMEGQPQLQSSGILSP